MNNYKTINLAGYILLFASLILFGLNIFFILFPVDNIEPNTLFPFLFLWALLFLLSIFLIIFGWFRTRKAISRLHEKNPLYFRDYFSQMKKESKAIDIDLNKQLQQLAIDVSWEPIYTISKEFEGLYRFDSDSIIKKQERKIIQEDENTLIVVPKKSNRLFLFYVMLIAVVLLAVVLFYEFNWVALFSSIAIMVVGYKLMMKNKSIYYFNKLTNSYGIEKYDSKSKTTIKQDTLSLNEISALQIIYSLTGSIYLWELNLITNKAERINIIQTRYRVGLIQSADILSRFLHIPIWEDIGVHMEVVKEDSFVLPTLDSIIDRIKNKLKEN